MKRALVATVVAAAAWLLAPNPSSALPVIGLPAALDAAASPCSRFAITTRYYRYHYRGSRWSRAAPPVDSTAETVAPVVPGNVAPSPVAPGIVAPSPVAPGIVASSPVAPSTGSSVPTDGVQERRTDLPLSPRTADRPAIRWANPRPIAR